MSTEKTFDERLAEAWDEGAKHGTYRMNRGEAVIYDLDNPYRRKPIPEPTVPWVGTSYLWRDSDGSQWTWGTVLADHGAPVAVSLPHWSDEVDGLRARVEKLADDLDSDADAHDLYVVSPAEQAKIFRSIADRIRALLAEGGEA